MISLATTVGRLSLVNRDNVNNGQANNNRLGKTTQNATEANLEPRTSSLEIFEVVTLAEHVAWGYFRVSLRCHSLTGSSRYARMQRVHRHAQKAEQKAEYLQRVQKHKLRKVNQAAAAH